MTPRNGARGWNLSMEAVLEYKPRRLTKSQMNSLQSSPSRFRQAEEHARPGSGPPPEHVPKKVRDIFFGIGDVEVVLFLCSGFRKFAKRDDDNDVIGRATVLVCRNLEIE